MSLSLKAIVKCERCGISFFIHKRNATMKRRSGLPFFCEPCRRKIARMNQIKSTRTRWARFEEQAMELNECVLTPETPTNDRSIARCADYFTCRHEWKCLCAVADLGWPGWKAEKKEGKK